MAIYLSPVIGSKIVGWSISDKIIESDIIWNRRNTYFVFVGYALDDSPYKFSVDVAVSVFFLIMFFLN